MLIVGSLIFLSLFSWVPPLAMLGWSFYRKTNLPVFASVNLQLSAVSILVGWFFGELTLLASMVFPLSWLIIAPLAIEKLAWGTDLLYAFGLGAILAGGLFVIASRRLTRKGGRFRRNAALAVFLGTLLIGGLVGASIAAEIKIQRRADELGAICVRTRSFVFSIGNAERLSGRRSHAIAIINGQLHHWSYRLEDFYPWGEITTQATRCPPLRFSGTEKGSKPIHIA